MISFKAHIIVTKYVFKFYKINLNFKHYHRTFFSDMKSATRFILNGFMVSPNYFNVYTLIRIVKTGRLFTTASQKTLEDYVSLTRAPFVPVVKTWCDWCSICNGYLEFLIDSINEYYKINDVELIERSNLNLIKLKLSVAFLKHLKLFAQREPVHIKSAPSVVETDLFPDLYERAPQYLQKLLQLLTKIYNILQEVEQLWCPFNYMKNMALLVQRNPERYAHYLKCENWADVVKAGNVLFQFQHIKCHQCVDVINERFVSPAVSEHSALCYDYFKMLCRFSRGETK